MEWFHCPKDCPQVFVSTIASVVTKNQWGGYYCYPHFVDEETELRHIKKFAQGHRNNKRVRLYFYLSSLISEPILLTNTCNSIFLFCLHHSVNYVRLRTQGSWLSGLFSFWSIMLPQVKHHQSYCHVLCHRIFSLLRQRINSNTSGNNS